MFIFQQLQYDADATERINKAIARNSRQVILDSIKKLDELLKTDPSSQWAMNRKRIYEEALRRMEGGEKFAAEDVFGAVPRRSAPGGNEPEVRQAVAGEFWSMPTPHSEYGRTGGSPATPSRAGYVEKPEMKSLLNNYTTYFEGGKKYVGVKWDDERKEWLSDYMRRHYGDHIQDMESPWKMKRPMGIVLHSSEGNSLGSGINATEKRNLLVHFWVEQDGKVSVGAPLDSVEIGAQGAPFVFSIECVGMKRHLDASPHDYPQMVRSAAWLSLWLEQEYPSARGAFGGHYEVNSDSGFARKVRIGSAGTHTDPGRNFLAAVRKERERIKRELGIDW